MKKTIGKGHEPRGLYIFSRQGPKPIASFDTRYHPGYPSFFSVKKAWY